MGHTFFFLCMSCKVLLTAIYFRYYIDATLDSLYPGRCWWFCLLIYLVIWLDEISTVCVSHSMWLLMSWHVGFVFIFKPGFLEGLPLCLHSTVSMWRLVRGCSPTLGASKALFSAHGFRGHWAQSSCRLFTRVPQFYFPLASFSVTLCVHWFVSQAWSLLGMLTASSQPGTCKELLAL